MDANLKNKLIFVHGGLMVFVWLIAVPLAIGINMYARKKGKPWGPKVHMIIMAIAAFVPYTTSAIIAFVVSGEFKPRPHSGIGTALSFGLWTQVALGIINHLIFRYRRAHNCLPSKRPWNNHVHIWFGKILLLLALINVPLGMRIKRPPMALYIVYAIWVGLLIIGFVYLACMRDEVEERRLLEEEQRQQSHLPSPHIIKSTTDVGPEETVLTKSYVEEKEESVYGCRLTKCC
ncbi:hypothetical protein BDF20DRAFT_999499 [Mycotypha africana]|uniref:uncharacterized protein n=1 Tax=Mycotypha africana TaxID=64632 RepID=UPI002301AAEF|nr:uncharacterized protein BDF20DRAFT_999499 [Mycotypha africana]KAI8984521.1 hypothetical protein BDF20DRAFT_999499 [Mycotypha africana]